MHRSTHPAASKATPFAAKPQTTLWICAGLVLLVVLIYGQATWHEFVMLDDNAYVYENPQVLRGLSWDSVKWAFTTLHAALWQPLTWLSLMLDAQIYGQNPAGFHVTNVFFHTVNVLLLLFVMRQLTGALWPSVFVAALFA